MLKLCLKYQNEQVLVFWPDNTHPFVVATTPNKTYKPGDLIDDWYHGSYYKTVEEALTKFYKKSNADLIEQITVSLDGESLIEQLEQALDSDDIHSEIECIVDKLKEALK